MFEQYINILGQELITVSSKMVAFLPNFLIGVLILLIGWLFGVILGRATIHIFDILGLDNFFGKAGLNRLSRKSGYRLSLGVIFGAIVRWTVIIAFALAAANVFGLHYVSSFLIGILNYLPSVFIAGFIIVIGTVLANFVEKLIDGSVRAAGLKVSIAGTIARYAIMLTAVLAALNQLDIVTTFTNAIFIGFIGAISLALGLAFGLGGKEAAARAIDKIEKDFTKK
ncbi:hypothetical protein SDC9_07931 [bioreactor metagenome]|uniref:Small-conductance mechanosensitive channel n=1 Tax=bioreactor metagenome TaxID=1076179 RepID=A0A644T754_9ZZZZ|nr:hypothetical protein [Candidatus Elulimicrobiales bacterium]